MRSPETVVIIVTYNALNWISKCLQSIGDYKTIVIDNNSNDGTRDLITSNFPNIQLVSLSENLGFGKANNIGISKALQKGAKHIFLLNQDAYINNGCIERLVAFQSDNPDFGILSPVHLNGTGNKLDALFFKHTSIEYNPLFYSELITNEGTGEVYEFPYINAAAWLLSKKCVETIGGFDPIFFHYGEDHDFCNRARYHGFKIGVHRNAFIRHDRESRKTKKLLNFSEEYLKIKERNHKIRFTDINKENFDELAKEEKIVFNNWLKNIFRLRFKRAVFFNKEKKMLNRIKNEISDSRQKNKNKGNHYLDL